MKRILCLPCLIVLLATLALLPANGGPAFANQTTEKQFSVGRSGNSRERFKLQFEEPGCIWARATWTGTAENLSLILNGPGQTWAYDRQDGPSGMALTYGVTRDDLDEGTDWTLTIANFGSGRASGDVEIGLPANQVPCELEATAQSSPDRISLSWRYTARRLPDRFLVERSQDQNDEESWESVGSDCIVTPRASRSTYSCTDHSALDSDTLYYYRACSVPDLARECGALYVSPSVAVHSP